MTKLTVEKVLEHHLTLNMDQKITPHLVAGLIILITQNLRNASLLAPPSETVPTDQKAAS